MRLWRRDDVPADEGLTRADVERAYEKGRTDERHRHHSHPILGVLMFLAAVVGVGMIYLAAREGSFSRGGEVVDQKLASAADNAQVASQDAASAAVNAGDKAKDAGQNLRQNTLDR